jgi:hypothetical protein
MWLSLLFFSLSFDQRQHLGDITTFASPFALSSAFCLELCFGGIGVEHFERRSALSRDFGIMSHKNA